MRGNMWFGLSSRIVNRRARHSSRRSHGSRSANGPRSCRSQDSCSLVLEWVQRLKSCDSSLVSWTGDSWVAKSLLGGPEVFVPETLCLLWVLPIFLLGHPRANRQYM